MVDNGMIRTGRRWGSWRVWQVVDATLFGLNRLGERRNRPNVTQSRQKKNPLNPHDLAGPWEIRLCRSEAAQRAIRDTKLSSNGTS